MKFMNKEYPLVTIAIPTYNRADNNLPKALDSALRQTYKNIEVIVSDNCSTDGTEAMMRNYQNDHLKYVRHKENLGANGNFNACLHEAKGDYFLLLHDDDLIDDDFVDICMKEVNYSRDYGLVRTGTRVINSDGDVIYESDNRVSGLAEEEYYLGWFSEKTSWYLCSTLFNTEALRAVGGFTSKHNLLEDGYAIVNISEKWQRADVRAVKASFRKHLDQRTFAVNVDDWCDDFAGLLDLMSAQVTGDTKRFREKGTQFFSGLCQNRARMVSSPWYRAMAYISVGKHFGFRYMLGKMWARNKLVKVWARILKA